MPALVFAAGVGLAAVASAQSGENLNPMATLEPSEGSFWAGELFPITFTVQLPEANYQSMVGDLTWAPEGLNIEDWTKPDRGRRLVDETWMVVQRQTNRGYVATPGRLTLPSASQKLNVRGGGAGSSFQQGGVTMQVPVASAPVTIDIKALPQPAPAGFAGAVGQFELKSTVAVDKVNTGESVTWTLELAGTGNWPQIRQLPAREVAKSFEIVSPGARRTAVNGSAFDATLVEDLILVPRRPGTYTLGPVNFVYFDPAAGEYRTLTASETALQVIGAASEGMDGMPEITGVVVPDSPPVLPLDPAVGAAAGLKPLAVSKWWILGLTPVALLAVFWLALAARRRHATDPLRPRRLARERLMEVLRELDATSPATMASERLRAALFRWERTAADMLGLDLVAPSGPAVATALREKGTPNAETWLSLWSAADRAIFSAAPTLPADWVGRAKSACASAPIAGAPLAAAFLPRNLLPFAVAALVLGLGAVPSGRAEDAGTSAYAAGDFVAAEAAWGELVAVEPMNAYAHHNRSLALAQLDRWSEAAAESLVALCLAPADAGIRWQLIMSLDRAGIDQTKILAFAHRPGLYRIVTLFSVGGWAWVLGAASLAGCAALGLALALAYAGRRGWSAGWPIVPAVLAALVVLAAVYSRGAYGLLGDERTAVVAQSTLLHSIPTEANAVQKTVPLPAGSLATGGRTFLGWTQLHFPNGQTGWVRTEQLRWIYR